MSDNVKRKWGTVIVTLVEDGKESRWYIGPGYSTTPPHIGAKNAGYAIGSAVSSFGSSACQKSGRHSIIRCKTEAQALAVVAKFKEIRGGVES